MVYVKVCGITTPQDARSAAEAGADAIGLVFFPKSLRNLSMERAREVAAALPTDVLKVGVFVDTGPVEALKIAEEIELDYAQLHGNESPDVVDALQDSGLKVIKAFRVRNADSLATLEEYGADLFLLDAYSEKLWGGSGERFDWSLAKLLRGRDNILVSGGLGPENVREAIRFFEPYGVDASSSLEDAPGERSRERVRRFVSAAKG